MTFNWVNMQVKPFLFSQVFFVIKEFLITKNYQTLFLPIRFFRTVQVIKGIKEKISYIITVGTVFQIVINSNSKNSKTFD